ncbi:MAG: T9SS type A sorting domain-containing protein, partial [Chitinophagaceae bacterium]
MRKVLLVVGLMITGFVNGQWSELGGTNTSMFHSNIRCLSADVAGNIYAAGDLIDSNYNMYVAKWNGNTWNKIVDTNCNSSINNCLVMSIYISPSTNLYAGGFFFNNNNKYYVAKWDGNIWNELGGTNNSPFNNHIYKIKNDALGNIYVAGAFTNGITWPNGNYYVAKWNSNSWIETGGTNTSIFNGTIESLTVDGNGFIYAAGTFTNSNGKYYVAKWNGVNWSEVGGNNNSQFSLWILDLATDALGNIYATGGFKNSSGKYYVAKWNGISWSEVGGSNTSTFNNKIARLVTDVSGNLYVTGEFTNGNGKYYIAKWNGISWSEVGGSNTSTFNAPILSVIKDAAGNIYAAGGFTNSNGKTYVAKYTSPLPLKILSFNAKQENNKVLLNWQTANEVNVSHINIQRSNNGKDFTSIGKVNAACCNYNFIDPIPNTQYQSTFYYRLEIEDKDGSKTYSTIQQITIKPQTPNLVIYPNPTKGIVNIECVGAKQILIIDYLGRTIKQFINITQPQTVNTKHFVKGIYTLQV